MQESALQDLWAFDVATETWTEITTSSKPPEARSFHRMICVQNALYVFGGCGATSGRLADLHRFDLTTLKWEALAPSTLRGRGGPNFCALNGGNEQLLVWAGFAGEETNDGQVYDIASNTWKTVTTTTPSLPLLRPRSVCVAGTLGNGSVVVLGNGRIRGR